MSTQLSMSAIGYVGAVPALVALVWAVMIFAAGQRRLMNSKRITHDNDAGGQCRPRRRSIPKGPKQTRRRAFQKVIAIRRDSW